MKSKDVLVGTRVRSKINVHDKYSMVVKVGRMGTILCNQCRIGDEICVVEWDFDFGIDPFNINDLDICPDFTLEDLGIQTDYEI